ncbi:hypothetical protein CANCADRAFT_140768 [Tortispora caseinolytica NRRL Y-17796]|uniref:Dynactin subunit 4 n=1 Tax=Tortispora caseinolytica NRRL Y-17796 TaxID=767744 RepID=A0A1E4TCV4_9ASCO|nr:hypothetical protein CANCADRAFT_140768 [Tortispora caseinolytica NRRL Y-17796]
MLKLQYVCSCYLQDTPLTDPDLSNLDLKAAKWSCNNLTNLFFCVECQALKCKNCTADEIAFAYCPTCLRESPVDGVSRCKRNCILCPECGSLLTFLHSSENSLKVKCPGCQYSNDDLEFFVSGSGSLVHQLHAYSTESFGELLFKTAKHHAQQSEASRISLSPSIPEWPNFSRPLDHPDPYECLPKPPLLRSRRSWRCRQCRFILVKPDNSALVSADKPQQQKLTSSNINMAKFKINLQATDYVPTIYAYRQSNIIIHLLVANPLTVPIKLSLSVQPLKTMMQPLVIISPDVSLGPCPDRTWEPAYVTAIVSAKKKSAIESDTGVIDQGANWSRLQVIANALPGTQVPIFVSVTYQLQPAPGADTAKQTSFWLLLTL